MKDGFELRKSSGKGEGIYATQSFTIGDIVMVGVIKEVLNGNHSHASQVGENKFVLHDGLITKVNHACDPNCGIRVNEAGGHNFVAITKISVNEEITFDYAMRNYRIDYFPKECMCSFKKCRGRITGWKDLPDEKKKDYEGFAAPYLLELDANILVRKWSGMHRKHITIRSSGLPKASQFLHTQKYAPLWEAAELSVMFQKFHLRNKVLIIRLYL